MANWLPPVYRFAVRNEYDLEESRAILSEFKRRFPFSHLPDRVKLWPRNLEQQFIMDLELSEDESMQLREIGRQHEQTRVYLFQEMVKRIRASDEDRERDRRRILQLQAFEQTRRAWFRRRLASRQKRLLEQRQRQEVWIAKFFIALRDNNNQKVYISKY